MTVIGCDDGTYGYNCSNNCSGQCLNDSPCNKETGHCDRGCKPGYTNNSCNEGKSIDQSLYICCKKKVFSLIIKTHHQIACNFMLKKYRSS